jgi:hypothetical protein
MIFLTHSIALSKTTVNFHQELLPQILGHFRRINRTRPCLPDLEGEVAPQQITAPVSGVSDLIASGSSRLDQPFVLSKSRRQPHTVRRERENS